MSNFLKISFGSITGFLILFTTIFVPVIVNSDLNIDQNDLIISHNKEFISSTNSSKIFSWPSPGYTTITCKFGNRIAPTTGASTYHGAIDIGAPTNSKIIACFGGKIIYTGFYGANGYTIMLQNANVIATYSHLSPEFTVTNGEQVFKNQVIGKVGPKNVYGVPNNKYIDSNR